jgi:threonine/homoserine/homoserine lactone efflux protein
MMIALVVGLVVGLVLSIPPGPIAVAVIKQALEGNNRSSLELAGGAAGMDILYSMLAAFASSAIVVYLTNLLTAHRWVPLVLQVVCVVVLVVIGIRYLRSTSGDVVASEKKEMVQEEKARQLGYSSPFIVGVLIALTNLASPTFLPSLIFITGYLHSNDWVGHRAVDNIFLAIGFGLGAFSWFLILTRLLTKFRSRLSENFVGKIYRFAGGSFILFALILAYNIIRSTDWQHML